MGSPDRVLSVRQGTVLMLVATLLVLAGCSASSSSSPSATTPSASSKAVPSGATVEIGVPIAANVAGGLTGASGSALPTAQQEETYAQAIFDYINGHGGLHGHQIKPVWYEVDATTATAAAVDQAACQEFTQDNHVFAALSYTTHTETWLSCMQRANALTVEPGGYTLYGDSDYQKYSLAFAAGALTVDQDARVLVNGLFKDGYFSSGAKIGLVGYNTPSFMSAIKNVLIPALASHGLHLTDQQEVSPVQSYADASSGQQELANAAVRFKGAGIDHVIVIDTDGAALNEWKSAEAAQHFYPRLGITTNESPASSATAGGPGGSTITPIFTNALGVGWDSLRDVPPAAAPHNATADLCDSIVEKAGASAQTAPTMWVTCDQLLVLQAAANAATALSSTAVIQALPKVSITTAESLGPLSYPNGRHDGAAVGKFMAWHLQCKCFEYTSQPLALNSLTNG